MSRNKTFHYSGFSSPAYTQVPDDLFDVIAPELTEAELRVLLYIIRRTYGFKKESDNISLKQLVEGIRGRDGEVIDRGAGISKPAATRAVKGLIEKGIIRATRNRSKERGDEPTTYALRFYEPVLTKVTRGGKGSLQGGVNEVNPQNTVRQDTDISNIRKRSMSKEPTHFPKASYQAVPLKEEPRREVTSPAREPASSRQSQAGGMEPIGQTLLRYKPRGVPLGEDRQAIGSYIADFAREFSDKARLKSSTTRAYNLYQKSGVGLPAFISYLFEAAARTKEGSASVPKAKMAYFFAILEDILGLKVVGKMASEGASAD